MTACTASNKSQLCPRRQTCQLYLNYLEASGVVALVDMPVSAASSGCYMYQPASAGIREAVRRTEEQQP